MSRRRQHLINEIADRVFTYLLLEQKSDKSKIKPGVAELFESNPELASQVYEATGFNNNTVFETEEGSVYYLNNGKTKRDKKTSTGRIQKFSESDNTVYITEKDFKTLRENSEGLKDLKWSDNSVTVTNGSNRKITVPVKNNPEIGLIPLELVRGIEETETGYREDKRINIKSYSFLPNGVSFHAGHKIVSINTQTTSQQKQQAQQLYSQYLDTIFPNSKIKDIVYHGSPNKEIQSFLSPEKEGYQKQETTTTGVAGIYFSNKKEVADLYQDFKKEGIKGKTYPAVINAKRPLVVGDKATDGFTEGTFGASALWNIQKSVLQGLRKAGIDAIKTGEYASKTSAVGENTEIAVFEPKQIHILGSKQDIKGFKDYVKKN